MFTGTCGPLEVNSIFKGQKSVTVSDLGVTVALQVSPKEVTSVVSPGQKQTCRKTNLVEDEPYCLAPN